MYDQQVYESAVRSIIAMALAANANEVVYWRNRRDTWLQDAAIKKATHQALLPKPDPPAKKAVVIAPAWSAEVEQYQIRTLFGPDPVDDPACDLPPDPVPGTPGTVDVGDLAWEGPPVTYACGALDTALPGATAMKDGHRLVKMRISSPFGRDNHTQWYQGV